MTLRVTVEIVPYGDENYKTEIGRLDISNVGTVADKGLGHKICKYEVLQLEEFSSGTNREFRVWRWPYVAEHDRKNGFWKLLYLALKEKFELDDFSSQGEPEGRWAEKD
jgi:hypothetical protein